MKYLILDIGDPSLKKVRTDWSDPTQNITEAVCSLMRSLDHGYNAWLEIREDGNENSPKENPALLGKVFVVCYDDQPFNSIKAFERAGEFLIRYSEFIRTGIDLKRFNEER